MTCSELEAVYIIYSADVVSESVSDIERMDPKHILDGYPDSEERRAIVEAFTETEDDDQYEYGYLGNESGDVRYFPYGYLDSEGLEECESEDDSVPRGLGQHRKWVAELTVEQWRIFADAFQIELDESGLPTSYEHTAGSITEHGLLPAITVDNTEGWGHGDFGYGPVLGVISSEFYLSFAGKRGDECPE